MANKDTGGSISLAGLRFTVRAVASVYAVELVAPDDRALLPSLTAPLSLLVSSASGIGTDVEIQVATDAGFTALVYSNTLSNRANGEHLILVPALTNLTKYHWRARAAETGTTSWGAWTPVRTFTPNLDYGKGFLYSTENVGIELTVSSTGVWASVENVGVEVTLQSAGVWASVENVGVQVTLENEVPFYVYLGDVSTNPPAPHLWFLVPTAGRSGDGIKIYCFGVGDLATTFSGVVELDYGAQGWVSVPVTSWQTFPAGPDAYTAARKLDPEAAYIDMQYTAVEITIPDGALPPGYPLRIRTVTP